MSNNNLELMVWGDGTIRLSWWDSLHGEDKVFVLDDDGNAYMQDDDGSKVEIPLVLDLRDLAKYLHNQCIQGTRDKAHRP